MTRALRIGTRKSPLAMWQATRVSGQIQDLFPGYQVEIIGIETTGDKDRLSPLNQIGGKGVFIREIEHALINMHIDIGVHCLKDVTTNIHPGTQLSGFLAAESVADALVSHHGYTLSTLPMGATVGTGSMRRQALLKAQRPDVTPIPIRGNIETRVNAITRGDCVAILLSEVSLTRLGLAVPYVPLTPNTFTPAPGQGVITLQTRQNDTDTQFICDTINDPNQKIISESQLQFLQVVGFDCQTPLGIHTQLGAAGLDHQLFRANASLSQIERTHISDAIDSDHPNLLGLAHSWRASMLS